jgi:hypothetical protein
MARRGKGEGSIRRRKDGLWEARISVPGPGGVGSQRLSFYGGSRAEVADRLAVIQRDVQAGVNLADARQFTHDYLAH